MKNNQNSTKAVVPILNTPTQTPLTTPTATGSAEEQEVQDVDIEDPSPTEFPAVESDIQGL